MSNKWSAKITNNYFITHNLEDNENYIYYYENANDMMVRVSYLYAFDDCECEYLEVQKIVCNGIELQYCGWQPNMKFEYMPVDKSISRGGWCGFFPSWDH